MKNLLEHILIHLASHPEDVVVEETEENGQFLYHISVHPEDIGKIIGRSGNVIQAIRTLAKVRAIKENKLIRIFVNEPEGQSGTQSENPSEDQTETQSEA